jgi:hypothetical protein
MSGQHTPGPWEIEEDDYGDEIWLGGEGAGMIVVNGWVNGGCKQTPSEWAALQAEARLIAAAPDLLALVIQYRDDLRRPPSPDSVERSLQAVNAAIAKATGQ